MGVSGSLFRFGVFEADARTGELRCEGVPVRLPQKPFQVLAALLERPGELVTREELRAKLWPRTVVDFDNGLNAAVNKLREALEDSAEHPRFIETLPRRGYRFIAPVEHVDSPPGTVKPQRRRVTQPRVFATAVVAAPVIALLIAAALWWTPAGMEPSTDERVLLAVLPFQDLGTGDAEYFSDGLTEELITELGRLDPDKLGVIARTSVMRYKGTTPSTAVVGAELGVDYLLEGGVRREGDRVRVSAQLVQVSDQTQVWAERYDRALRQLLQVQSDVARAVAAGIRLELPLGSVNRLEAARQIDPEAYDAYLRGRHLLGRRTEESIRAGIGYFRRAIEVDPAYAPAYAGLARAYELEASYGSEAPSLLIGPAKRAADAALRIDKGLAEAHAVHALLLGHADLRWRDAEEVFLQALSLEPNSAFVRRQYAAHLSYMGRFDEAVTESRRAVELDPISLTDNAAHGIILYRARRYEESAAHLLKTLELDPNYALTHLDLGLVHAAAGRPAEAVAAFERARVLSGDHPDLIGLAAYGYGLMGEGDKAREALRELTRLSEQRYVSPYILALVRIGLGESAAALDRLEQAYSDRVWTVAMLKVAPELDPLRGEPRFQALLERMDFPSYAAADEAAAAPPSAAP